MYFFLCFKARKELLLAKPVSGREISLSKLLLNADFIPGDVGKAGQELIACQVKYGIIFIKFCFCV